MLPNIAHELTVSSLKESKQRDRLLVLKLDGLPTVIARLSCIITTYGQTMPRDINKQNHLQKSIIIYKAEFCRYRKWHKDPFQTLESMGP